MKKTILAAVLVIALLAIAACEAEQETVLPDPIELPEPETTEEDILPEEEPEEADIEDEDLYGEGDVKTFTVIGGPMFEFFVDGERNADMVVNEGDLVRIIFEVDGGMPHDWVLDEFGAATQVIETGDVDVIEFVADQAGEFEYYCSVGQHRANGMVGRFIVE